MNQDHLEKIAQLRSAVPGAKTIDVSSTCQADRVANLKPLEYLIEDILIGGQCCTLTGEKFSGKTTLMVSMAIAVAGGTDWCGKRVKQGNVLNIAGENCYDTDMKFNAYKGNLALENIHTIDQRFSMREQKDAILAKHGGKEWAVVFVDSNQAYFGEGEMNSNGEQLNHIEAIGELCKLPGNPVVIALSHPNKSGIILEPYGGGSVMNAIDTNFTLKNNDGRLEFSHTKRRGNQFLPVYLQIRSFPLEGQTNNFGGQVYTSVVDHITQEQADAMEDQKMDEEQVVIDYLYTGAKSFTDIAIKLFGFTADETRAAAHKTAANRLIKVLREMGLIEPKGTPTLTKKGKARAVK